MDTLRIKTKYDFETFRNFDVLFEVIILKSNLKIEKLSYLKNYILKT